MDIKELHERCLYPVVRVYGKKGGGSGTLIYSKPNKKGEAESYILTCHHVISDLITHPTKFDSWTGKDKKIEVKDRSRVEFFGYNFLSRKEREAGSDATIEAYDERQDLALLKLTDSVELRKPVVVMYPKDKEKEITVWTPTVAVGCSLLHPPIVTPGFITSMNDVIDTYEYWMSNSAIIYGNSGGAMFKADTGEFLGLPARIAVTLSGFMATDAITHMGYFIPINRVYQFLEEQLFQFIGDKSITSEQCFSMRNRKKEASEKALEAIIRGGLSPDSSESEEIEE